MIATVLATLATGCARPREGIREASARQGFYHTVRRGDTLSAIARRYGLSTSTVAADNALADPDHVEVGQRLFIRATTARRPTEKATLRRLAGKPSGRFAWPVRGAVVVRFGQVVGGEPLRGIVIRPSGPATVRAADAGRVVLARQRVRGYGGLVVLDHGNAWTSVYARLGTLLAREGAAVAKGEALARASGEVEFRLYRHGVARDPLPLLR